MKNLREFQHKEIIIRSDLILMIWLDKKKDFEGI
jgi:hypothetical protein